MNKNPVPAAQSLVNLWVVVVVYHPDIRSLRELCNRVSIYGSKVVVVDNTEEPNLCISDLPTVSQLHRLSANTGIAYAQNVGITSALAGGARSIIFFDQDSTFEANLIPELVGKLRQGVPNVVAPRCIDAETGIEMPSHRLSLLGRAKKVYCGADLKPYPVDIVISSGTAVTREAIELVGYMDEDLFIDYVDTEWCLRCRSKDITIKVVPTAVMYHRIGSRSVSNKLLTIMIHSPFRCYYQIRNSFHLFRRRHIPCAFAAVETLTICINRLLLLPHVNDRKAYVKAYLHGFYDGMLGIVGPRKIY